MKSNFHERRWTDEDLAKAAEMREAGHTWKEIGEAMGRSANACGHQFRINPNNDRESGPIRESERQRALRIKLYGDQRYA